ncbi:MAG: chemotaxis protein CheX [Phycisphaerae bacterium]|nr:chemotaxis protein CheX [Phycisphaerae bacterium]
MNNKYDEELYHVAEETFAALAFIMPLDPEDETPDETDAGIVASVTFTGEFRGIIFLSVPAGLLPELSANMLGAEDGEEPPIDEQHDAFAEALNVICGNLLPIIAGTKAVFDVHAPKIMTDGRIPDEYEQYEPAGSATLIFDTGKADMVLFIDKPAA